jgi:hypothetical protein
MSFVRPTVRGFSSTHVLVALLALAAHACASSGGGSGSGNPDVITPEQIAQMMDRDALEIVQRYKPGWLRPRQQASLSDPNPQPIFATVHLDETRLGDAYSLDRINANQIDRIEFMSALDATTRFGTGYSGGLIIVRTIARSN